MINLEWEELDRLEIEEKVQEVLDYSYTTWMSDKKNIRYFVRAFYIRWDMLVDMYEVEDDETEGDKLKYMYDFGISELGNITEVNWIMGYCMEINPIYFEEDDNYLELEEKGKEMLRNVAINNPDDVFLTSFGIPEKESLKWKRANKEQLIQYGEDNFSYDSEFSSYFKYIINCRLDEELEKESFLRKILRRWKQRLRR
ncbi:hypothetical protein HCJ20_03855 [Listeria sp. FSL L7-1425]|uniref:hypothetical protein n=1 Tax=Listeria cossartiae TaxID=2838249 RepID=UPI00162751EC|nr:hypothetical protein [Listeria cossartiae]MBC1568047.1 hypothetical protein [Listeria cossartiae subsp. cossartiae]